LLRVGVWRDELARPVLQSRPTAYREASDAFVADSADDAQPYRLRPTWRRKARPTSIASITARPCKVAAALIRLLL
jgi:hypothetical protein